MNTFDFLSPGGQPIFVTRLPNERGKGKIVWCYVHNETELQGFISRYSEPDAVGAIFGMSASS